MTDSDYWNSYYSDDSRVSAPIAPSQFAAFVLTELKGKSTHIVDFGCGNGRDTLFFARHGYNSIGVDESEMAIKGCTEQNVPNADFLCASVDNANLADQLTRKLSRTNGRGVSVYARFFVHAINEVSQANLLKVCREIVSDGGMAAFEFRTNRDASQTKITPDHYRRFVKSLDFMAAANANDFSIAYFVEGFGFAKYRDDDAHVARFILEPSR